MERLVGASRPGWELSVEPEQMAALAGHPLPAGTFVITAAEQAELLSVIGGEPPADGEAHALWAYVAPQRGIGIGIAELCALADYDVDDGPMLGSVRLECHVPLQIDETYDVEGEVVSLVRKSGRSGIFDLLTYRERLVAADGAPVVQATNTFVLPRRDA